MQVSKYTVLMPTETYTVFTQTAEKLARQACSINSKNIKASLISDGHHHHHHHGSSLMKMYYYQTLHLLNKSQNNKT